MDKIKNINGFTLVEVIAAITILEIIAGIAVISVGNINIIENAREDEFVTTERKYDEYLALESLDYYSGVTFTKFKLDYNVDICLEDGVNSYVDGEMQCSVHDKTHDRDSDEDEGGVPYL